MANIQSTTVQSPFGLTTVLPLLIAGGTQTFTIQNGNALIASTIGLTANTTINLAADINLPIGSEINIHATASGAQYTLAFSGAVLAPTITIGTGSSATQKLFYDGAKFYPTGAALVQ